MGGLLVHAPALIRANGHNYKFHDGPLRATSMCCINSCLLTAGLIDTNLFSQRMWASIITICTNRPQALFNLGIYSLSALVKRKQLPRPLDHHGRIKK